MEEEDNLIEKILSEIDLRTKLKVNNEFAFVNLLTDLCYRKDKLWTDDEDEILSRLIDLASELADTQMEEIENHYKTLNKQ